MLHRRVAGQEYQCEESGQASRTRQISSWVTLETADRPGQSLRHPPSRMPKPKPDTIDIQDSVNRGEA